MTKSMLEQAKELLELAKSEEKLEKAKFDTGQKGVHRQETQTHYFDNKFKRDKGVSVAGKLIRQHNHPKSYEEYKGDESAKEIHKEKLQELKDMPKPKLDKFEKSMLDDKLTKSLRLSPPQPKPKKLPASSEEIKNKPTGHEKGVHRNFDSKGTFQTTAAGSSNAGSAISLANSIKAGKAFAGSTHNPIPKDSPEHGKNIGHAKNWHRKVLNELRSMKKPVLKAEDKSKMSGWSGIIRTDTEANQNQKGVHQHGYKGSSGGISEAGSNLRDSKSSSGSAQARYKNNTKEYHKQTLAELKAMPKPNLGKEEKKPSDADSPKRPSPCAKCGTVVASDMADPKSPKLCQTCFSDKNTKKAEHQPHPGPSISEHQKIHDAKKQSEEEARLKTPEGNAERKKRNKEAFKKAIAEDYKPRFKKECK
jgi:hypothetical protein